jgi:hypothetical protein
LRVLLPLSNGLRFPKSNCPRFLNALSLAHRFPLANALKPNDHGLFRKEACLVSSFRYIGRFNASTYT